MGGIVCKYLFPILLVAFLFWFLVRANVDLPEWEHGESGLEFPVSN